MQDALAPIAISAPQAEDLFPLALARQYAFPLQHHLINGAPFFAVQDWISGLTRAKSPSRLWYQIKRRAATRGFAFGGRIVKLPYRAANGRVYQMDFAELKPLYEIALKLRANTPALDAVWRHLWDAGMHLSSVDPSKVEDWIAWMHKARGDGVYKGLFVQAVQDALLCSAPRYKLPAYVRIFQRTARALYWFTYMPNQSDLSKKVVRALLEDFYAGIAELADDELLFLPVSRWLSIIERAIDLMSN
jgi:hypothetical protein